MQPRAWTAWIAHISPQRILRARHGKPPYLNHRACNTVIRVTPLLGQSPNGFRVIQAVSSLVEAVTYLSGVGCLGFAKAILFQWPSTRQIINLTPSQCPHRRLGKDLETLMCSLSPHQHVNIPWLPTKEPPPAVKPLHH